VSAFADGELSGDAAAHMETHLAVCKGCRRLLISFQTMDRLVGDLAEISVSPAFERSFREHLEKLDRGPSGLERMRALLSGWRPVWAAGVAACLVAGLFLYNHNGDEAISIEEIVIVENMDLFQDFELIEKLTLLEAWDRVSEGAEPS
jgi:hypothetical protein